VRIGEATNEKDLVAALTSEREMRQETRRGMEVIWWNNIALILGDHFSRWDPTMSRFEDRDMSWNDWDGKQPKLVINHALTVGRTELAKLTKSAPIMDIIANSDEPTDIAATKVGRSALDFANWKFQLPKLQRNALWWMIQTGLCAVYVGWDPLDRNAGYFEVTIDPETGDPTFDPRRERELESMVASGELDQVQKEQYPLGDLTFRIFSPFQLFPDPTVSEFDELKELITDEIADIDVIKGLYGRSADDLRPDPNLRLGTIEQRMLTRAGVQARTNLQHPVENAIRIHTFWLRPGIYLGNRFLKDGAYVRWAQGKVLDISRPFPYQDGRIPFVFYQHVPVSTSIWPDCVITHIRGPNLEVDKTVSQLIANKDYMSNPMWLIATQHRLKGEVKNVAGGIVRYRHVPNIPPPAPVGGLQMPQQVENLVQSLAQQILDISGQSEVAHGGVPSGVRSGVAVAYLSEEDDTKIAPTVRNLEDATALQGSLTLERFAQFYTFERILRFYRRDGIFDVRKFKGADLKNNTDVVCQAGSALPKMKAAKQQYVLELVSLGVLRDPHKIEQMLELGEGEPDDVDKAISQANRENNMMIHGVWGNQTTPANFDNNEAADNATEQASPAVNTPVRNELGFKRLPTAVPVKAWHNHQVHIQRHTSVMMDEEFDDLAVTHPEIVRLMDEHIAMHQQQLQAQQQQAMQALMAQKGAPDGPPGQSPGTAPPGAPAGGPDQNGTTLGVLATTNQPDPIAGGAMGLRTRNRVQP